MEYTKKELSIFSAYIKSNFKKGTLQRQLICLDCFW